MQSVILSERDRDLKTEFRNAGILQEVEGHRIPLAAGTIMVSCADGDQMPDIFNFQTRMFPRAHEVRVHTLALNGGALLLPESPLTRELHEDLVLLHHLARGRGMKAIDTVVLYAHAPCGVAYENGLDLEDVIRLLVSGRERLLREMSGVHAHCFLHVDRGGVEGKRTYFVSPRRWYARGNGAHAQGVIVRPA